MKKLLGIVVLGLLLSGCADTEYIATETEAWRRYSALNNFKYRVWGEIYNWKAQGYNYGKVSAWGNISLDESIQRLLASPACTKGCKITHIGTQEISEERQKEIINKYLPPGFVERFFPKTKKIVKKKTPKEKKPKKINQDDSKVVAASSGSGFFVSKTGHIVTNYHVIDQCKATKVVFKGKEVETKVLAVDKTNDLAIIQANINPSKVYSVSNKDVTLLQDIIVAGFPLGRNVSAAIKTHKGSVTALAGYGDNYSNFQTDATINQGNSGGPVIDNKGNIVGVAVALMSPDAGQNIFFAVKSSTLKTFANANSITFLPPSYREMSYQDLGNLITEGTVFLECWMTVAKIKKLIAQEENRKAFYTKYQ